MQTGRICDARVVEAPAHARTASSSAVASGGLGGDFLLLEFQTVMKPLSKLFSQIRGIAGPTIIGTGEVALIIDAAGLVQQAASGESRTHGSRADLALLAPKD